MTGTVSRFALGSIGLLAFAVPAAAQESRTFPGVTPAVFECMRSKSEARDGTVYEPRDANRGTATTSSPLWSIVIDFVFEPATGDLHYTVVRKTFLIPVQAVWDGIVNLIAECASP
jgi:hypothetical protein